MFRPPYFYTDSAIVDMTFYNPHRSRRFSSPLPYSPFMSGNPYYQNPLAAQQLGAGGIYGAPRGMGYPVAAQLAPTDPRYALQPMIPQTGIPSHAGLNPYLANQQAATQSGLGAPQLGHPGVAGAYQHPYAAQTHPGMAAGTVPIPGAAGATQELPGSYPAGQQQTSPYGQNPQTVPQGYSPHHHFEHPAEDAVPPYRHRKERKKKSKSRKFFEDLLYGGAGAALLEEIEKHHKDKMAARQEQNIPNNPEEAPRHDKPPKGAAPGYLHPKGHFVPMHLEDMIQHFVHGNHKGDENHPTPESGAQTGYLHPGGHFVPLGMAALATGFKHTLNKHRKEKENGGSRSISSDESDSYDSDEGETESEDDERDRHRGGRERDRKR
jgi:hypothetical protein